LGLDSSTFNIRPSTLLLAASGGFVPDHAKVRSFVIKQISGFVFEKPSALGQAKSQTKQKGGPAAGSRSLILGRLPPRWGRRKNRFSQISNRTSESAF